MSKESEENLDRSWSLKRYGIDRFGYNAEGQMDNARYVKLAPLMICEAWIDGYAGEQRVTVNEFLRMLIDVYMARGAHHRTISRFERRVDEILSAEKSDEGSVTG